jgi:hypothetical protein
MLGFFAAVFVTVKCAQAKQPHAPGDLGQWLNL